MYSFLVVRGLCYCAGFPPVAASGAYFPLRCVIAVDSLAVERGSRTHRLQLLRPMWNLRRPGTEPLAPALASEFLSTGNTRAVQNQTF